MWECICRFNPYPSFISGIIKDLVMLILVNSFYASSHVSGVSLVRPSLPCSHKDTLMPDSDVIMAPRMQNAIYDKSNFVH